MKLHEFTARPLLDDVKMFSKDDNSQSFEKKVSLVLKTEEKKKTAKSLVRANENEDDEKKDEQEEKEENDLTE